MIREEFKLKLSEDIEENLDKALCFIIYPVLSQKDEIIILIDRLDIYARDYDCYEHGLPTHLHHLDVLVEIVEDWLSENGYKREIQNGNTQANRNLRLWE